MAIRNFTDVAYSKSVRAMQQHLGTRGAQRRTQLDLGPYKTIAFVGIAGTPC